MNRRSENYNRFSLKATLAFLYVFDVVLSLSCAIYCNLKSRKVNQTRIEVSKYNTPFNDKSSLFIFKYLEDS